MKATLAALIGAAVAQQAPAYYGGSSSTSSSASTTSAPASTTYACNPAHQYPAGQICTTISGSLTLVTTTGTSSVPTTSAYVDKCQEAYKQCIAAGQPEVKCSCDLTTCTGEDSARIREYCAAATANLTSTASATKPASYPTSVTANLTSTASATKSASIPTSTTSCAAPGSHDSQGRYSCNPAHQYPAGQTCTFIGGCPVLTNGTSSTAAPSATPSCPAAGSTDSKGRYSCNPAHQYPEGQTCELVNGCYFLVGSGSDVYTTKVETAYTTYCPQPTTLTHEQKTYTVTQATTITLPCKNGCTVTKPVTSAPPNYTTPIIVKPVPSTWANTTQPPAYSTKVVTSLTTYCPQPTTFTHQQSTYTVTKATTLTLPCKGGCTVTVSQPPKYTTEVKTAITTVCPPGTTITHEGTTIPVTQTTTLTLPCASGCTITKSIPAPSATQPAATPSASCPAPGSTDKNGRYSCNPAHQYPAGQTCELIDGCYYLVSPPSSSVPVKPSTYAAPPPSSNPPAQPTTYAAPPPSGPAVPPSYPTQPASSSFVSQPSATFPGPSTTSLTPYTGAAASLKTAAPLVAAMAMGALFL